MTWGFTRTHRLKSWSDCSTCQCHAANPHLANEALRAVLMAESAAATKHNLVKGWITPLTRALHRQPSDDEGGVVSGPPWHLEARCVVDGEEHRVSPVGIVKLSNQTRI